MRASKPLSNFSSSLSKVPTVKHYLCVFIITAFAFLLRFFMLSYQSLWIDEGYSLYFSDGPSLQDVISRLMESGLSDRFRILFYILLYWWRGLFGSDEFTLRSLPALFGFLATIPVYYTARDLFGKSHALWSFVLIAASSYSIFYSQEVRDYSMTMLIVSCQLWSIRYGIGRSPSSGRQGQTLSNSNWAKFLFAFLTSLGIFTTILMSLFSMALAISHFLVMRRIKLWLQWWIPAVLFSLPPVLFYLSSPTVNNPDSIGASRFGFPIIYNTFFAIYGVLVGITYGPPQEQLRGDDKIQAILGYVPHLLLLLVIATAIAVAIICRQSNLHRLKSISAVSESAAAEKFLFYLLVVSFLLGILFAIVTKINWVPRHLFYIWPVLALLLPGIVSHRRLPQAPNFLSARHGEVLLVMFIGINLFSISNYYFSEQYYRDDFRGVVQYVIENRDQGSRSLLVGGTGNTRLFDYYGDPETIDAHLFQDSLRVEGQFPQRVRQTTGGSEEVIIAANREHFLGPPGLIEREMSSVYRLERTVSFRYFKVYHFSKKSGVTSQS